MSEAISLAVKGAVDEGKVDFRHQSVSEAMAVWKEFGFNDLDAPYLVVGDEVRLSGREWRAAGLDSVVSILSGAPPRP